MRNLKDGNDGNLNLESVSWNRTQIGEQRKIISHVCGKINFLSDRIKQ